MHSFIDKKRKRITYKLTMLLFAFFPSKVSIPYMYSCSDGYTLKYRTKEVKKKRKENIPTSWSASSLSSFST